jgi:hypothetical protein
LWKPRRLTAMWSSRSFRGIASPILHIINIATASVNQIIHRLNMGHNNLERIREDTMVAECKVRRATKDTSQGSLCLA